MVYVWLPVPVKDCILFCQIKKKDTDKVQKYIFWLWWHEIIWDIG